jgi:electron transfer flavoprotein beta subunit
MRILVCIKQVPDPEALGALDERTRSVRLTHAGAFRMNRYDEVAVEEAIRIKERRAASAVDVISVGPERVTEVIRRALGMGADHGIHIAGGRRLLPPATVAAWLAAAARTGDYALILAGVMSEDGMHSQVGPMLAAHLNRPCATAVVCAAVDPAGGCVRVEREIEGGAREELILELPAVLTIQSGINRPRYPALSNLLRANRQAVERLEPAALPALAPAETLIRLAPPQRSRAGLVLTGSSQEMAHSLLRLLREKALLM